MTALSPVRWLGWKGQWKTLLTAHHGLASRCLLMPSQELGLEGGERPLWRTKANCLRICAMGPVAVVYPDQVGHARVRMRVGLGWGRRQTI